jgi:hypothetical protein
MQKTLGSADSGTRRAIKNPAHVRPSQKGSRRKVSFPLASSDRDQLASLIKQLAAATRELEECGSISGRRSVALESSNRHIFISRQGYADQRPYTLRSFMTTTA